MKNLTYRYLMLLNHSAYQKQMYESITELNLSIGQPKILDFLYENDGCIQKDIAAGCQLEPASVTSILSKMEQEGYVVRKKEGGNRRSLYVYLTQSGRKTAEKVRIAMEKMEETALNALTEEEQKTLMILLKKVNTGLLGNEFVSKEETEESEE